MKPIEPGCKARVVNSTMGYDGIIVTVIRNLGSPSDWTTRHGDVWETDMEAMSLNGVMSPNFGERQLERIDYDGNETTEWEAISDIWTPERVAV